MKTTTRILLTFLVFLTISAATVTAQTMGDLVASARAEAAEQCDRANRDDRLFDILCDGVIRIGVRDGYARFATELKGERSGFEIEVARMLAEILAVDVEFVDVSPVTRISSLSDGAIDLAIATMGHNSTRDSSARFIRPHYYSSQTIIVGPKKINVLSWADLADKTVCTTVGNYANSLMVPRVARLMLFDTPARLVSNLRAGTCSLIAQDDSVLAEALADPEFAAEFEKKLGFAEIPWGMAVSPEGSDKLGDLLDALSVRLHADGSLLALAQAQLIATEYLERMQHLWAHTDCQAEPATCVSDPLVIELTNGPFKSFVDEAFLWVDDNLAVFFSDVAWTLFTNGIIVSLIAVVGVLIATSLLSGAFAACLTSKTRLMRWPASVVLAASQSSPPLLILVFVAAIANSVFTYSQVIALLVAILSIGLMNGAFAGQAIADALKSIDPAADLSSAARWQKAVVRSAPQIEAFLTNATRGISAASFVGVADLTNALNDITSFSRNQSTTYWILLVFYIVLVMIVVRLCRYLRKRVELLETAG